MYEVMVVSRLPAASGPPTFIEVAPLRGVAGLTWTRKINRPGSLQLSVAADLQYNDVKQKLINLSANPIELWCRKDDELVFQGPLFQVQVQGPTITLQCADISAYMDRWAIYATLTYTAVDQLIIAKNLVDYHQGLSYGHFGVDASHIGTSGVTRDRTYAVTEPHWIMQRISELAEVDGGFEWTIDPSNRWLRLAYPYFTSPTTIIVDAKSVQEASAIWGMGPDDYATTVRAFSKDISATATSSGRMAIQGRLAFQQSYQDISRQTTLDKHAARELNARQDELFAPTMKLVLDRAFRLAEVELGMIVSIDYDFGLGRYATDRRLVGFDVQVDASGSEHMTVEVA